MKTKFVEVTNNFNWGKFCIAKFDEEEMQRRSQIDEPTAFGPPRSLLNACGWETDQMDWIFDLQTGEGAIFRLGGSAHADLEKHKVWVCPMFEPFLEYVYDLYEKGTFDFDSFPNFVTLSEAPRAMYGYRRLGGRK